MSLSIFDVGGITIFGKDENDVGGTKIIRKVADETVNDSNTLQNDDELLFAVGANEIWEFLLVVRFISNVNADFSYKFTIPAGGALECSDFIRSTAAAILDGAAQLNIASSGSNEWLQLRYAYIGGAAAGNLQLQWAQQSAHASDSKVLTNSFIIAHRLA